MSRGTQDHCPQRHPSRSAYGTLTRSGAAFQRLRPPNGRMLLELTASYNPALGRTHDGLGSVPFRSPLLRESRLISLPRGTEMFQFPRCPPSRPMDSAGGANASTLAGCPIRIRTAHRSHCSSPSTFRRVSASFFGPWPLGIHPHPSLLGVPFPASISTLLMVVRTSHVRRACHAHMASCLVRHTGDGSTHITSLACDRFASHSARIGKIEAITAMQFGKVHAGLQS